MLVRGEKGDKHLDEERELDDAGDGEGEEDGLSGGAGGGEIAEADGEEGNDREIDALEVGPVLLLA
jgi:hypothetical protein